MEEQIKFAQWILENCSMDADCNTWYWRGDPYNTEDLYTKYKKYFL